MIHLHTVLNQEWGSWYSAVLLFPSCSQVITLLNVPPVPLCLGIFLQLSTSLLWEFFSIFFPQCFSCQWMVFPAFSSPEAGWRISYLWIHCCASPWGRKVTLGQPHCWICWCTGSMLSLGNCASWNTKLSWSFTPSSSLGSQIHNFGYGNYLGTPLTSKCHRVQMALRPPGPFQDILPTLIWWLSMPTVISV